MNILLFLTRYMLFLNPVTHIFVNFAASVHIFISKQPAPLLPPSFTLLDYCNSLYYNLPEYQLNRLQLIQTSLTRAVIRAPESSHIIPFLRSLHWLKIKDRIDYKILSLTKSLLLPNHLISMSMTKELTKVYYYH